MRAHEVKQQGPLVTFNYVPCFLLPINFFKSGMEIEMDALIDSKATASFSDINFVQSYRLSIKLRNMPIQVEVVYGRIIKSRIVTNKSKPLKLYIDNYVCKVASNVIKSPKNYIILGQNWLEFYNLKIN